MAGAPALVADDEISAILPRKQAGGTPTYALAVDVLGTTSEFRLYATVAGVPGENVDVTSRTACSRPQ